MSLLEPDELTRTDVIEYFIKALPLPLPLELVPMALYITVKAKITDLHFHDLRGTESRCWLSLDVRMLR